MKTELYSATFTFTQEGDSCDTDDQTLTVEVDDAGGGKFFRIKTKKWSINEISELTAILEQVKSSFGEAWDV